MIEPLLIAGIAITCCIWYIQHRWRRRRRYLDTMRDPTGLEVLGRRYARGEIDRDEYLAKRADLLGYTTGSGSSA
jgi:uncharacterized membrane protein